MLERITPLLLTFDEMPNLERTLAPLAWARRIIVVDSGSTDGTLARLRRDPRIDVFVRPFEDHTRQWNFGLDETGIDSEWILCLDADHCLTDPLVDELRRLEPPTDIAGYEAAFTYCIGGQALRASLYPPRIVLARRGRAHFRVDGHSQRLETSGRVERLYGRILHDDRKPRSRWLAEQLRYAGVEAEWLDRARSAELSFADRLRRLGFLAPWLVPIYCLTMRRGLFDGKAGWIYAGERAVAEWLIAINVLAKRTGRGNV